jgi:MFS transporter, PPP family, 3-phenylpropionic acid transporter
MKQFRFWASAFYFAYFAASGTFFPFLNAYYQDAGIPIYQIGILAGLPTLIIVFASPLWSLLADTYQIHGRLLPAVMLLNLPFAFLITRTGDFLPLAILTVFYAVTGAPIIAMGDNAVMQRLGDQRYEYGKLRVWGAVGYGLSAWYGGWLIEHFGLGVAIFIFLTMMSLGAYVATHLYSGTPKSAAPIKGQGFPLRRSLELFSTDTRWYGFLIATFTAGLGFSSINNYLVLHIRDLGAGEGLYGFSITMAGISELPIFFFSALLLKRFSPRGLLAISFSVLALRLLLTSLLRDPSLVLVVQLFHGLSFSALWSAGVNYANEIAPPGLGTSAQALFGTTLFGLAGSIGAVSGGWVYQNWSGMAVFQMAAAAVVIGWVIFALLGAKAPQKVAEY